MQQGSEEWHTARLGKVTASKVADVMAKTKSGYSASRKNYAAQLLCERLTNEPTEFYLSPAMQWGTETEPQARDAYQFLTDNQVVEVGFVNHPTIEMSGASPDGLVCEEGLIEIKCPNSATHLETLTGGKPPTKYNKQMQWQLACTERAWCDFVSFDPRLPEAMRLFRSRVLRDEGLIKEMEGEVTVFLAELQQNIDELLKTYGDAA